MRGAGRLSGVPVQEGPALLAGFDGKRSSLSKGQSIRRFFYALVKASHLFRPMKSQVPDDRFQAFSAKQADAGRNRVANGGSLSGRSEGEGAACAGLQPRVERGTGNACPRSIACSRALALAPRAGEGTGCVRVPCLGHADRPPCLSEAVTSHDPSWGRSSSQLIEVPAFVGSFESPTWTRTVEFGRLGAFRSDTGPPP